MPWQTGYAGTILLLILRLYPSINRRPVDSSPASHPSYHTQDRWEQIGIVTRLALYEWQENQGINVEGGTLRGVNSLKSDLSRKSIIARWTI